MNEIARPRGEIRAKVAGTGAYLPGEPVDNKRLADFFGRDIVRVSEMLGGVTRHLALDVATGKLEPASRTPTWRIRRVSGLSTMPA